LNRAVQGSHTTCPTLGIPLWKALAEKFYSPEGPNFKYLPAMQFCNRQASLYSALTFHKMTNQFPLTCTFCFTVLNVKMQTCRNKTGNVYIMQQTLRHIRIFASWTFLRWPYHLIHRGHNFYCCYISVQNLLFIFTLIVSKLNLSDVYNLKFSPC